jgi:hypothetical protein
MISVKIRHLTETEYILIKKNKKFQRKIHNFFYLCLHVLGTSLKSQKMTLFTNVKFDSQCR